MLSDRQAELLTAYVDGELEPRERQAVDRILDSSVEARSFLERLQADSKELHNLPSRKAPETLADAVMGTVWDTPQPGRREPAPAPPPVVVSTQKTLPRWFGFVAAALVLMAVAAATYFLSGMMIDHRPEGDTTPEKRPDPESFHQELLVAAAVKFWDHVPDSEIGIHLDVVKFEEEPIKNRLQIELKKEPGFWFDVPCGNNKRAIERWTDAFKSVGVTVLEDPAVNNVLGKKGPKTRFVLYAENLTYDDVGQIFQTVGMAEQKAPAGRTLNRVIMTRITPDKRAQVAKAMGLNPAAIDPGRSIELPPLIDTTKKMPLEDSELSDEPLPRFAILFTMNGDKKSTESKELQRFLDSRKGFHKGTVQVIVDIHEQPQFGANAFGPPPGKLGQFGLASAKPKFAPPFFGPPPGKMKAKGGISKFAKKGAGI